jgi:hypothetical protein
MSRLAARMQTVRATAETDISSWPDEQRKDFVVKFAERDVIIQVGGWVRLCEYACRAFRTSLLLLSRYWPR